MPRGDRTGPAGFGPMTGRGMGYCAGYDVPGYMNPGVAGQGMGRGMGFGRGRGMGAGRGMAWGRGGWGGGAGWFAPPAYGSPDYGYSPPQPPSPEMEKTFIEGQLKGIKAEMEAMEKRLSELASSKENK